MQLFGTRFAACVPLSCGSLRTGNTGTAIAGEQYERPEIDVNTISSPGREFAEWTGNPQKAVRRLDTEFLLENPQLGTNGMAYEATNPQRSDGFKFAALLDSRTGMDMRKTLVDTA